MKSKTKILQHKPTDSLDDLPVAVIFFDNKQIYYLNKIGHKILGAKKPCDFTKHKVSVFDFLLPEFHQKIRANNVKILSGKPHERLEFTIRNLKGEILHMESSSNRIDFNGKKVIQTTIQEITKRKAQEQELKEVREQFKIISNNAHDIIYFFSYTPKPHYLYISPSVEKVLGYKVDNFYKDPFFINKKTIGKDNELKKHEKQAIAQQKNNTLKQKKVIYKMTGKDGKEIWMEDHILPIKDEKGKIKFVFGIVRNITDLKEKEKELNQKWSNYRELLNESPMAFFIHRNGFCEMCNKEATKILKVKSPEAILGKYLINYIVPHQRTQALERVKDVLMGKELDFTPYKIIDSRGKVVNIELKSVPIKYNGNNCVLTLMQDVTTKEIYAKEKLRAELAEEHNKGLLKEIDLRKRIEKKLIENESQLINQAAKLSAIFESSTHLVWTVNKNFELTYFNANYKNTFKGKYGIAPVIGQVAFDLIPDRFKTENKDIWHPLYRKVLKGEQIVFERRDKDNKGEEVYREVFLSPIKNENGKVFEIACLAHDITENKRYEKQSIEQASKIKAIFESGTHIMWTLNKAMDYTSFNQNFSDAILDLYGKRPEINKKSVRPEEAQARKEYEKIWNGKYEAAFNGKIVEFVSERTNAVGKKVYRQVYLHPIYNNKEVVEVSGMGIDITDKIASEQKIVNQAAKLNAVFEGSSHYIWTIDKDSRLTSFNKNYVELITRTYGTEPKIGMCINAEPFVSSEEYNNWWVEQLGKALKGERLNFETVFTDEDKNKIYLDIYLNPIYHENRIIEVSGIAHDITGRIQNEEQIKEQTAKLKAIFESGNQLIWTINRSKEITSFNKNYGNAIYKLYGFYPIENKSIRELSNGATEEFEEFWDEKYKRAFNGTPSEFTTERINRDGTKVFRQYVLYPIKNNEGGVIEVSGMGIDITENKLYEEKITQSLKEKEVLLKEVHHRVKNNMQVISSILNLQSSYVTDAYALNLLKESQNRIKTMAYIHESLYQNKTFTSINFSDYISTLTNNILQSYAASIQKVKLEPDVQKIILNLDTSIPAGLIINELVTNSIKHAFTESNEGIIYINLHTKDNVLFLEVSDNGKGFPKEIDFRNTNSLGLQLVNTLVEQLNGKLELKEFKGGGTSFLINFPM
ncbi:MAG: PAS domain S-box protein [Bacteroidia bacterium]|nr:PAS domain S-box protein [Bacteroidia bacterium]